MCRVHDNRVRTHRAGVLIDHQEGVVLIQIAVRDRDRAEFAIGLRRHRRECFDRAIGRPRRDVSGDNARDVHPRGHGNFHLRRGRRARYGESGAGDQHRRLDYCHTQRIPARHRPRKRSAWRGGALRWALALGSVLI